MFDNTDERIQALRLAGEHLGLGAKAEDILARAKAYAEFILEPSSQRSSPPPPPRDVDHRI